MTVIGVIILVLVVIWAIDGANNRETYCGTGEYCAEPLQASAPKNPINPAIIRGAVFLIGVALTVVGLIVGIEWLWFWSAIVSGVAAYPVVGNWLDWFRK
jgi:hypothetical protein